MKKTRIIKLIIAIAAVAAALPEAQAIVRRNIGGNWTDQNSWYKSQSELIPTNYLDNTYVRFQAIGGETAQYVTINSDIKPAGGAVQTDYTFYFNNVTYTQQRGVFGISKDCTLTLNHTTTGAASMELAGFADATFNLTGNVVVEGSGMVFRIGAAESAITESAGTISGTITVGDGATFALNRNVALSGYTVQSDTYHVDVNGVRTDGGDYFDGAYDNTYIKFVELENGGTVQAMSGVVLTQSNVNYTLDAATGRAVNSTTTSGGDMTTFYKGGEGDLNLSDIVTKADGALTTVELSAGTLTVDALVSTVNATGGTLAFVGDGGVDTINVNGDTTVSGDTNPEGKVYKIAATKVVTFAEDLQLAGLSIVGAGGVTVKNVSGETVTYELASSGALLSADEITMIEAAEANVTVGNQVAAGTVKNDSGYTLTLGNGNSAVQHVLASKGNIIFHNMGQQAVSLAEMTIGEGKQVGVYQGTDENAAYEGSVSISDTLAAKGGTLLANLDLQAGSTLDLGGGQMALGSELTLQEGLIQLDAETLAAIAALQDIGDKHILINNYVNTTLSYQGVNDGDWARTHFDLSSITNADYKIVATGTEFGLVKCSNVPEPTTGTLSLLALCALAARRRKH